VLKLTCPLLFILKKIVIVMKPLRVFSIITVVLVIASSGNIFSSFRLNDNHVNSSIGSSSSLIDNIFFFLSGDGKSSFSSSLLQTTSAQELEEQEAEQQEEGGEDKEEEQEENGKDSDMAMEKSEEEDEAESESDPSTEQDQQKGSQEERPQTELEEGEEEPQERDEIKADCRPGEHFDSAIDACIPDQEKVCDDQRDNDRDSKVDSEDLDCLPTKNEQLTQGEEARIANSNNEQENKSNESPTTLEQQDNNTFQNESVSSGSYGTIDGAQNNQNLANSNSSVSVHDINNNNNNNNTSLNKSLSSSNASAAEGNLTLTCPPTGVTMVPGEQATLTCTLESKGDKPENLIIDCSGLQNSRIECYIDGQYLTKRTLINPMSHIDFSIVLISQSMPPTAAGTYSFDISVDKCINSDQC
jgi:hypothetical protein